MNIVKEWLYGTLPEYIIDNVSIQGYSHKLINKECQDNSLSWRGENHYGIIVCDGHGGEKYIRSAIGSKIACEVGQEMISGFMAKVEKSGHKIEDDLVRLENAIVSAWREKVEAHLAENPLEQDSRYVTLDDSSIKALEKNPIKAYGSTFIAGVIAMDYCFILQLGDGNAMLFFSDGSSEMPEELVDEELQFNVTTSLCNSDAALCFRHCYRNFSEGDQVVGMTLSSDGVINCYHTEEAYMGFMNNVFSAYGEETIEDARSELLNVLDVLSEKGSGDDLSVAIMRRKDYVVPTLLADSNENTEQKLDMNNALE